MATYYWVGGAGTWDSTSKTNWAASSGGGGGAGFPTILDDVIFDTSSGTGTVTINSALSFCRDFTVTASQALTFSGTTTGIAGNISLPSGGSASFVSALFTCIANSAKTITTNGKTIQQLTFNGINGSWTLQDALTVSSTIILTAGTFNTNNQSLTSGVFNSSNTNIRAINLGSSTFTIANGGAVWTTAVSTNLTFNAGTSTIAFTSSQANSTNEGLNFYNVSFTGGSTAGGSITGNNTFNNLTISQPTSDAVYPFSFGGNQTITGTFTVSGGSNVRRNGLYSNVVGTQRTLTVNAWSASPANLDFRDIAITGAVGTLSGTSIGDCGNNSGVTFTSAKTVYWNLASTTNWSSTGWATTSGGTPNSANFPLAQDTCVFDNAGAMGTVTINGGYNIGTIDASTVTSGTLTVIGSTACTIYGDFTLSSSMSTSGTTGTYTFSKQGIQTINTNSVSFQSPIIINSGTGTLRLLGNLTQTSQTSTVTSGTLDLNNFTFSTTNNFILTGTLPRSIAFGTGNITLTTANVTITAWSGATLTNFTLTGTPTVNVTGASTSLQRTISHGSTAGFTEANAISVNVTAGSSTASVLLQGGLRNINLTGYAATFNLGTRTIYGNLLISTGTTIGTGTAITTFAGTSVTQDLTSNGKTLDFPIFISGTGNTLRLLDALNQGNRSFQIDSGNTFNANTFSASVGALTFTTTPNIINLVSGTLTAASVVHTSGNLIMSASLKVNVTGTYTLNAGTLDFGNQSVSLGSFISNTSSVRTINLGSGTITLTGSGATVWNLTVTNTTLNAGTSTLNFTSASAKTMSSLVPGYYNVNQGGAGALTLADTTFNSISNSVQPTTIIFIGSSTTTVANLNLNGTAGNLVTLNTSNAGSTYNIEYTGSTVNTMNFVSVTRFASTRNGVFFATNSTDAGANQNVTFAAADTTTRYWVLGTGTWTSTATANWATSSGGSGGASAPTIETNVIFDANSNVGTGAFTVTLTGTGTAQLVCNDLSISGLDGTLTWAGSGALGIYGSALFPAANFTRTSTSNINFRATTTGKTITSNGQTLTTGSVIFTGIGGGWTLADAFNISTGGIIVTYGTFSTGGFAVTCGSISSTNSNVRAINFGASAVGPLTSTLPIDFTIPTNLTFNAGTSTITSSGTPQSGFNGGGQTFYNYDITATSGFTGVITGANTFNNLTIAAPATAGVALYTFSGNQTINGTLSCSGATAVRRVSLRSNTLGTQRTLTVNAFTTPTDIDFRDINIAGAASPVSGTRLGNAGGNSNITFDAPKTVYWNLTGTQFFNANAWATTPAGTPAVNNFPLAQDTAVFTNSGAATTVNLSPASGSFPTIDMSARTLAMNIDNFSGVTIYGSWTFGSGVTYSSGTTLTFSGRGSQTITSAGIPFSNGVIINCFSGTYTLADALTISTGITVTSGTFNSANQTITATDINIGGTITRTVNLGTSTINLTTQFTPWEATTTTGLTFTGSAATYNLTSTVVSTRTFNGGGLTYGTLNIGGTTGTGSVLNLTGLGTTFNNITSTKTVAHTISIQSNTTINFNNFSVSGSAGNLVTLTGSSATTSLYNYAGTGVVSVDYISGGPLCSFRPLPNTAGTTPYSWYLGANSVNTFATPRNSGAAFIAGTRRAYLLSDTTIRFWTVPENWDASNNNFYLIGAGSSGGTGQVGGNIRAAGGGGGGGGYVGLTNLSLTASSILPVSIGVASAGAKGQDTNINSQYLAGGGQVGTADGTPTSAGGAGGIGATYDGSGVLYNGGAGGAGAFGTVASTGYGGGGGGGPAGPLGNGGAGGLGFASTTQANISGGGGGGNSGGSAGGNGSSATGGTGGNNASGIGGGASGTGGTFGGGGGGGTGTANNNGTGGSGIDILNTIGGQGGAGGLGGGGQTTNVVGFGNGTGGANVTTAGASTSTPGAGGQGVIFIVYTPFQGFFVSINEAFTANNTQFAVAEFNGVTTENTTLADTQTANAAFNSDVTEPITVEDTQTVAASFIGVITENTQIADTPSAVAAFAAAIVEAATLADADSVLLIHNTDIFEAITLADSQTGLVTFAGIVFENINIADSQSVVASFAAVITEDTNLQDLQEATAAFVASLAEAITAADSSLAVRIHNSAITENTTLANTQTVVAAFAGLVSENINPADAPTVIASFNSQITENLVLLDEPFPRGWYAINDEQTTVWTKVNNSYP